MASLDFEYKPNKTDDVIITDKTDDDLFTKNILNISQLGKKNFKKIWDTYISYIKKAYNDYVNDYNLQKEQIKDHNEVLEYINDMLEVVNKESYPDGITEELLIDRKNAVTKVRNLNIITKKKQVILIKLGNAICKKNREMATALLFDYKNILDELCETTEEMALKNELQSCPHNPITLEEEEDVRENEGAYLHICKTNLIKYTNYKLMVQVLINEYYRL
tara:strand:- start:724 stop:1383 length:660 start_codon:yes stop_codon:yes gene_type:complete